MKVCEGENETRATHNDCGLQVKRETDTVTDTVVVNFPHYGTCNCPITKLFPEAGNGGTALRK